MSCANDTESGINKTNTDRASDYNENHCTEGLSAIDAFLYGLPGGLLLAGLLLFCFISFGKAITSRKVRNVNISASSNTRINRQDPLGKKRKRGPPPSSDLRPVDVYSLAHREDAPDDIKAMAFAS